MNVQAVPAALRLRRLDLAAVAAGQPDAVADHRSLVRRGAVPDPAVRAAVRDTLADVRSRGDEAVRAANARVGGGRPDGRLVATRDELVRARDSLAENVRRALDQAIAHVTRFAQDQRPTTTHTRILPGVDIERRWTPCAVLAHTCPAAVLRIPVPWS